MSNDTLAFSAWMQEKQEQEAIEKATADKDKRIARLEMALMASIEGAPIFDGDGDETTDPLDIYYEGRERPF